MADKNAHNSSCVVRRTCENVTQIDTQYIYDGDGKMVKSIITTHHGETSSTVTTYYMGGIYEYEEETNTARKYYAGVAMRENDNLYFTLRDHLGSTSVVANANGEFVSEVHNDPFGGTR